MHITGAIQQLNMSEPKPQQQSEDIPERNLDSEETQNQNFEVNVLVKENGSFHNTTKGDNGEHNLSSSSVRHARDSDDVRSRGRDARDSDGDSSRNIVSRMQNYSDMPSIGGNAVVLHSDEIIVHNAPVNYQIEEPSATGEFSTNNGNQQQKQRNADPQPSSSSVKQESRQMSSIDSTITVEPETEDKPVKENTKYVEETWEHAKATRYRRRAIFCTDTYNNIGDMAREKELSDALITIKERWSRRPKLDRKLSEVVMTRETTVDDGSLHTNKTENGISTVSEDGSVGENGNHRPKKLTMKDVFKELQLMRQVVAACVRTDSSVVRKPQDKPESIASPSNVDIEKKDESSDPEPDNATVNTTDIGDPNESDSLPPDKETEQTEENIQTREESQEDPNSDQDEEEVTTVRRLSSMEIENDDDEQSTEDTNDQTEQINLPDVFAGNREENQMMTSDGQRESTKSIDSCDQSLYISNDVREKVPSRLSFHIDQTADEEASSRKDSTCSMDWASTYSNMNDVVIMVDDYKGESVVGCVVYTETDRADPARCSLVYPADVPSVVTMYENVVSNILHIVPAENQDGDEDDDEVTIAIPFLKDEMHYYQEPVLRVLNSQDRWSEYPCRETLYHRDDDPNLFVLIAKFSGPTKCVIVAQPIVDDIVFTDKMTRFHSTVDNEIILTCPVSARINAKNVHVELKVLPVLPYILEETKMTFDTDRQKLYNVGAIVTLKFFDATPQTIYMHLPCTRPPVPSRPTTGSKRASSSMGTPDSGYRSTSRGGQMGRKSSTFGKFVEPSQEKESHLVRFASCMATKVKTLTSDDVTVDDQTIFSVHEKSSTSVVLEVTEELSPKVIQDLVPRLLSNIEHQNVHLCLAQNKNCLNELAFSCDRASNVDSRQMLRLHTGNIVTTRTIKMREGDTLCLCFRGNISSISNHRTIFRYYGIHGVHTAWTIDIVDRFCQRSLSSFCGFLQIFVWKAKQPFDSQLSDVDNKALWDIVTEIPISLPKTVLKLSTKLVRAPVTLRNEGTITPEFLEDLAKAIGEGWLQLANSLNIGHPRIQSIKQQHKGKNQELARDILMTWFKRSLIVNEKASALIVALRNSGRDDLADALRDSNKTYRQEQARNVRGNRMETVILSVCKSSQVVSRWRDIASMLDMSESEIHTIDTESQDDVARCRRMLSLWKQKQNGYGIRKLVKCLNHLGLNHIADHLTSMMTPTQF